jgi:N-acetylmuramoyl-L-alanine amidase
MILKNGMTLGKAKVIVDILPKGTCSAWRKNTQTSITIHNVGNRTWGMDIPAKNFNGSIKGNNNGGRDASWHFTVDDKEIYQHIDTALEAWHTGVGQRGNCTSIGIEICMFNDPARQRQAEDNAIALVNHIQASVNACNEVRTHKSWSGKQCPAIILERPNGWAEFLNRIAVAKRTPAPAPVKPAAPAAPNAKTYIVAPGDTFYAIARKTGVSVADLQKFNPRVKPTAMHVGDVIYLYPVPQMATPAPKPAPKPAPAPAPKPQPKPAPKPAINFPADLPVKKGSRGNTVKTVQRFLGIAQDGIFGSGTEAKVKAYQRMRGITSDGIVGKGTWTEMFGGK